MNVYDFDKTIYSGDSSVDFYLFCLKRHPDIIKIFPKQLAAVVRYWAGKKDKTAMKEDFFSFLTAINDADKEVKLFWNQNIRKIKRWYIDQQQVDDVVISASPEFLLRQACKIIGIKYLIASEVDSKTGKFLSANCRGKEKVIRFTKKFPNAKVNKFYSDSKSDKPMAELAEAAYIVQKNQIRKWTNE